MIGSFFAIVILSSVLTGSGVLASEIGNPPSLGTSTEDYTQNVGEVVSVNETDIELTGTDPVTLDVEGETLEPPGSAEGIQVEVLSSSDSEATIRYTFEDPVFSIDPNPPTLEDGDGSFTNRDNVENLESPTGQINTIGQTTGGDDIYILPQGSDSAVELTVLGTSSSTSESVSQGQESTLSLTTPEGQDWEVTVRPTSVSERQFDNDESAYITEGQYTIEEPDHNTGITGTIRQLAETVLFIGEILVWFLGFIVTVVAETLSAIVSLIAYIGGISFYLITAWTSIGSLVGGVLGLMFQGITILLFVLLFNGVAKVVKSLPTT